LNGNGEELVSYGAMKGSISSSVVGTLVLKKINATQAVGSREKKTLTTGKKGSFLQRKDLVRNLGLGSPRYTSVSDLGGDVPAQRGIGAREKESGQLGPFAGKRKTEEGWG